MRHYEPYEDEIYTNVIKNMVTGKIYSDAGEIADLLNQAGVKETQYKLVLRMIIEDLEKGEGNEKYIEWIKSECDVEFFPKQDHVLEGMPPRQGRTYKIHLQIRERLMGRIAMAATESWFKIPKGLGEKGPVDDELIELINNLTQSGIHEIEVQEKPHDMIVIVR